MQINTDSQKNEICPMTLYQKTLNLIMFENTIRYDTMVRI